MQKICISTWVPFQWQRSNNEKKKKKDIATLQHSTCVSSEDPDDALRSMGSVGFVARPWSALFWSGWGWAVCVLSVGAFGVTEVSGLRVLLCEAAALHPPAAPLPWCGASVYLKAECKFTTLVKTSGSQNTQAQCDKHHQPKHDKTWRHSVECLVCFIAHLLEFKVQQQLRMKNIWQPACHMCCFLSPTLESSIMLYKNQI